METLRLLNELADLIMAQKTLLGVTSNFHPEKFLDLTNKIRATMLSPSSPERMMETTKTVLERHLRSSEEVAAVMSEIRSDLGTMS